MRGLNQLSSANFTDATFVGSNAESLQGDYRDEASINSSLQSYSATTYSDANLELLTLNDKIFALRSVTGDSAGFMPSGASTFLTTEQVENEEEEPDFPTEPGQIELDLQDL